MTPGSAVHEGTAHQHALVGTGFAPDFSDPAFDDIARLARHVCGSAIALVAVLERDGLTVRACAGLEARDISDAHAFCTHALRATAPVEIADARGDAQFAGHRLVAGDPALRFCAGIALMGRQGTCLGSLCVLDRHPRMLDACQRDGLMALARMTAALVDASRSPADGFGWLADRSWAAEMPMAWTTLPRSEPVPPRGFDARYAVAIIELDGGSVPAPARERVMQQIQDIAASVLGHDDVLSRDGPGELLAVFAHAGQAPAVLERIEAAAAALPNRPRIAIGAAVGRHDRDPMEDVFLEDELALYRARTCDRQRLVFASRPALNA
jgi:hypothetical protein